MQETQVRSLGREDSPGEGNGNPLQLPGKFHGQRSLVGYSPWGSKESDMTERLQFLSAGFFVCLFVYWFTCAFVCMD